MAVTMLHRKNYTLVLGLGKTIGEVDLPFVVEDDGKRFTLSKREGEEHWHVAVECKVETPQLAMRDAIYKNGEFVQSAAVEVKDNDALWQFANNCTNALVLLLNLPLRIASRGAELVPQDDDDRTLLEKLGTKTVHLGLSAVMGAPHWNYIPTSGSVLGLTKHPVAIEIFADAIQLTSPAAQFRELWRVLESGFGEWRDALSVIAAEFPPLQKLGVSVDELRALRSLRGDISHAWRVGDVQELKRVKGQALEKLGRLRSIVDCLILTKTKWGTRDLSHDPDLPMGGYVRADGGIVIFQARQATSDQYAPTRSRVRPDRSRTRSPPSGWSLAREGRSPHRLHLLRLSIHPPSLRQPRR